MFFQFFCLFVWVLGFFGGFCGFDDHVPRQYNFILLFILTVLLTLGKCITEYHLIYVSLVFLLLPAIQHGGHRRGGDFFSIKYRAIYFFYSQYFLYGVSDKDVGNSLCPDLQGKTKHSMTTAEYYILLHVTVSELNYGSLVLNPVSHSCTQQSGIESSLTTSAWCS